MRRLALLLAVAVSVVLSGVAVGSVVSSSVQSPHATQGGSSERHELSDETDQAGNHGGSILRFHQAGGCSLAEVTALPENWTHGDYVSAVAMATADSTVIVDAAHSDCGKPMVSVGHGTDHAMVKTEKHESTPAPGS